MAYNFTFYNNYESVTITAPLAVGATSLTVQDAAPLVSPAAGRVLRATLQSPTDKTLYEIINITVVAGNVLTIVKGQESTTDREWPAGTKIRCNLTAEIMGGLLSANFKLDLTNNALGANALDILQALVLAIGPILH